MQHETSGTKESNLDNLVVCHALKSEPIVCSMIMGTKWPISQNMTLGNSNMIKQES